MKDSDVVGNDSKERKNANYPGDIHDLNSQLSQVVDQLEEAVKDFDGKCIVSSFTPRPLSSAAKSPDEIMCDIQNAIVSLNISKDDDEPNLAILPALYDMEKLCIVSRSIIQYILCLDTLHADYLFNWIYTETTNWITHLFGLPECGSFYDDNLIDSITKLFRILLCRKCPLYYEDGFDALKELEPVIYYSSSSTSVIAKSICRSCGLPMRCSREIQLLQSDGNNEMEEVQQIIENDINSRKIPIMLLIDAGTNVTRKQNQIRLLPAIARQYDIWLHITGDLISSIPLFNLSKLETADNNHSCYIADSMTITFGSWLNIPALPSIILYKKLEDDNKYVSDFIQQRCLVVNSLPIWIALQCLGLDGVISRFRLKYNSCYQLYRKLQSHSCLKLLSSAPGYGNNDTGNIDMSVTDLISKSSHLNDILDSLISCVVFQFVPENREMWSPNYCDKLNSWLNQVLSRELPEIRTNMIMVEGHGGALQFSPFESMPLIDDSSWNAFYVCLDLQLDILQSTVAQKAVLYKLLKESSTLKLVELHDWAGLGGVRYIPQAWDQVMTDQAKNELNRLNLQIVEQLRNTDAAFSAGEGDDGLVCIRFGMTGSDSDVTDLVSLVDTVGKQEEDSWTFIDTMAEVVKKGIETATLDLQKENEDKLWQEGILRHVPVFGSIVNWWSPIDKDNGTVKGRSLDLNAGVICSTENIYRYHMQSSGVVASSVNTPIQSPVKSANIAHISDTSTDDSSLINSE